MGFVPSPIIKKAQVKIAGHLFCNGSKTTGGNKLRAHINYSSKFVEPYVFNGNLSS